jgi:hypothetical protein
VQLPKYNPIIVQQGRQDFIDRLRMERMLLSRPGAQLKGCNHVLLATGIIQN